MNICMFGFAMDIISGHSRPAFELAHELGKHKNVSVKILSSRITNEKRRWLHEKLLSKQNLSVEVHRPIGSINEFMRGVRLSEVREILEWADIIHSHGLFSTILLNFKFSHNYRIVQSINSNFKVDFADYIYSGLHILTTLFSRPTYLVSSLIPDLMWRFFTKDIAEIISWTLFMKQITQSTTHFNPYWIPVGVDLNRFDYKPNKIGNEFTFLYFGSLASARGTTDVIKAFEILRGKQNNVKLLIAHTSFHPSVEQKTILNMINNSKFRQSIEVTAFSKDISTIINQSNAVILPFRTTVGYSQPPLTVLEALAHGRPVISTNIGCIPEIIPSCCTHFIVRPRDYEQLSHAMKNMLKMEEKEFQTMSRRTREYIEEHHNWNHITQQIIKVYKKCLKNT